MAQKCHKFRGSPEEWAQKGGPMRANYFFSFGVISWLALYLSRILLVWNDFRPGNLRFK